MRLAKVAFVAIVFASFASGSVRAQDGVLDIAGWGAYGMDEAVREAAREGTGTKTKTKVKAPAVRLSYAPSAARRREFLKSVVVKMRTTDPKTAGDLEKLFASKDIFAEMGKIMAPYGLRTDNVADAYTLWWVVSWNASREREAKLDRKQFLAVKAQASRALSGVLKSSRVTDATKQQLAEACLIQTLLIDGAMEHARGDQGRLREIARNVNQGARASGLNLSAMELTPQGFVFKG